MKYKYEHKNKEGKTLFLMEVIHQKIQDNLCYGDALIHLPVHLPYLSKEIDLKIKSLESKFQNIDIDFDPIPYLKDIAILIEEIPNIEKLYAPDFLIDEYGNYDDSLAINYLNIFNLKKSYHRINYKDYAFYQLMEIIDNVPSYCYPKSNPWLFDLFYFTYNSCLKQNFFEHKISNELAMNLISPIFGDVIYDIYEKTGYFVLSHDDNKDGFILLFNDENSITKCYFCLKEGVDKVLAKNK